MSQALTLAALTVAPAVPVATPTTLGVVKVGANLAITEDGALSATGGGGGSGVSSFNSRTGAVSLTSDDVVSALGYTPGTGGGSPVTSSRQTYADFSITGSGPNVNAGNNSYKLISDTAPAGFNTGPGRFTVDFEVTYSNYFALNPNAHWAVVLRQDPALIATAVRGSGVAIGNLSTALGAEYTAITTIESWVNGIGPGGRDNWLFPKATTNPAKPIQDSGRYRYIIENAVTEQGQRTTRFRMYRYVTADSLWDLEFDSGEVLDPNSQADWTKTALYMGEVGSSTRTGWSINIANLSTTWSVPSSNQASDLSEKFSRRGGDLAGDLRFPDANRRVRLYATGNYSDAWTVFEPTTDNTNGALLTRPRGTATSAGFTAVNSPSTANFGSIGMQMDATRGRLQTISLGTEPTRPIDFIVGSTTVATASTLGWDIASALRFPNASSRINVKCDGASYSTAWTAFQASTAATNTAVMAIPNGAGKSAGFTAVNSESSANYGSIGINADPTRMRISSFSVGSEPVRNIELEVNGSLGLTVVQGGARIGAAPVNLGSVDSGFGGYNFNGYYVTYYSANVLDYNSLCTPGTIASYLNNGSGLAKANETEAMFMNLFGALGHLIQALKDRKVI